VSVGAGIAGAAPAGRGRFAARLALALAALLLVAGGLALVAWFLAPPAPPKPVRNPFGMGVREAAPQVAGIGGWILQVQSAYALQMRRAVQALAQDGSALWSLMTLGFAYGVFHAAGPGHGKAVIAAYLVSTERALMRGLSLSFAAALLQALVAITVVAVMAGIVGATAAAMDRTASLVETAGFAAVGLLGAALLWRKAGKALGVWALARDPAAATPDAVSCDHVHLPPPDALARLTRRREMAGVVLAAGIRPCAGALVVLVFALSQGLFAAGIAATLAMALGTALTTGALAALAVFFKEAALKVAGGRGAGGALLAAGLELLAAAFILALGLALLAGLWSGAGGS
jgi:ABC-type nickel/cobalt efflux system permease component RcnA